MLKFPYNRKRGLSHSESLDRILCKMIKNREGSSSESYCSTSSQDFDQELINKVRKQSGMNYEEAIKTLQLKRELDRLLESKLHQESCSSEESQNADSFQHDQLSPKARERLRAEKKYQVKYERALETLIERVDQNSGNSSSCEDRSTHKGYNKKRKLNEIFDSSLQNDFPEAQPKVVLHQFKRRHQNDVHSAGQSDQLQHQSSKKRSLKDITPRIDSKEQGASEGQAGSKAKRFRNEF